MSDEDDGDLLGFQDSSDGLVDLWKEEESECQLEERGEEGMKGEEKRTCCSEAVSSAEVCVGEEGKGKERSVRTRRARRRKMTQHSQPRRVAGS